MAKAPKFKANGEPDGRGHGEGSQATRFSANDGRRRPGRPKGSRDERSQVTQIRDMKVDVVVGGRKRRVNTLEAIMLKQRQLALAGNQRAIDFLERKFAQYEPPAIEPDLTRELMAEDLEILEGIRARQQAEAAPAALLPAPVDAAPPEDE